MMKTGGIIFKQIIAVILFFILITVTITDLFSASSDSVLIIFEGASGGGISGDYISNQDSMVQEGDFRISGRGSMDYLNLNPSPSGITPQIGDIRSMGSGETYAVYTYDGTCWRNIRDWLCYSNPTASILPDPATVCLSTDLNLDGNPSGGSGVYSSHIWSGEGALYLNNPEIQQPIFNSSSTGNYSLTYTVTDNFGYIGSDDITIEVVDNLPVSVNIESEPSGAICEGDNITFTATPTNGGTSPSYQWKINGSNVGSNLNTFSTSSLNNGDNITCVLTSDLSCATGNPATSNLINITVNPSLNVSVSISADPGENISEGTSVTFTANVTNGGSSPSYQWKLNGANVGTNSNTYTNSSLDDGDEIICVVISNASCVINNPATSNTITMSVSPACTGQMYGGYCWHLGTGSQQSCNDVCASRGGCIEATGINTNSDPACPIVALFAVSIDVEGCTNGSGSTGYVDNKCDRSPFLQNNMNQTVYCCSAYRTRPCDWSDARSSTYYAICACAH